MLSVRGAGALFERLSGHQVRLQATSESKLWPQEKQLSKPEEGHLLPIKIEMQSHSLKKKFNKNPNVWTIKVPMLKKFGFVSVKRFCAIFQVFFTLEKCV
jgi:hypothetical protein